MKFLVETVGVEINEFDKWGSTPYQNSIQFHHSNVTDYLEAFVMENIHEGILHNSELHSDLSI